MNKKFPLFLRIGTNSLIQFKTWDYNTEIMLKYDIYLNPMSVCRVQLTYNLNLKQ